MPRQPRPDLSNVPQHVVQRGNDRQPWGSGSFSFALRRLSEQPDLGGTAIVLWYETEIDDSPGAALQYVDARFGELLIDYQFGQQCPSISDHSRTHR